MNWASTNESLELDFKTRWTASEISWRNHSDGLEKSTLVDQWVRFSAMPGTPKRSSLGSDSIFLRYAGLVIVQIFTRVGSGSARALKLADSVFSMYLDSTISGAVFNEPDIDIIGVNDGWFQVNVSCPFNLDTVV